MYDPTQDCALRDDDFNRRIVFQDGFICQGVVIPAEEDRRLAFGDGHLLTGNRDEISGIIELFEERQARLDIIQRAAICQEPRLGWRSVPGQRRVDRRIERLCLCILASIGLKNLAEHFRLRLY